MDNPIDKFIQRCMSVMSDDSGLHEEIEVAYEQCIVPNDIKKSEFLRELGEKEPGLFAVVTDHLFTPINWSKVAMKSLWGIKNTATGNLVSLGVSEEKDGVFILRDGGSDISFSPMTSGEHQHILDFLNILQKPPTPAAEAPLAVGETIVELDFEKGVNPMNLKIVEIKVIF